MKCVGIVAEYNPFHAGHAYHLERSFSLSSRKDAVIVMSGHFVQRGDIAIFDKFHRAKRALENGAGMVLELPTAFALSCAEKFSKAAITILDASGIVDKVSFGSECADVRALSSVAAQSLHESEAYKEKLKSCLDEGLSFPKSHALALGETDLKPNDILGVEYIKALYGIHSAMQPIAVRRIGAGHDAHTGEEGLQSASAIRAAIHAGGAHDYARAPVHIDALSDVILYALRSMTTDTLAALPDVREGLENVLFEKARLAATYAELLALLKNKRYTLARLRRITLCALLRITQEMQDYSSLYIRVLGVRRDAMHLLSELAEHAKLPVITKYADACALSQGARQLHGIDLFAGEVYALAARLPAAFDYSAPLIIV